jgi:hypothetical protein
VIGLLLLPPDFSAFKESSCFCRSVIFSAKGKQCLEIASLSSRSKIIYWSSATQAQIPLSMYTYVEKPLLLWILQDFVGQELLVDLPMVYLFFDRSACH